MEPSILEKLCADLFLAAARILGLSISLSVALFLIFNVFGETRYQHLRLPHARIPQRWMKEALLSQLNLLLLLVPIASGLLWGPDIKQNYLSPWIDTQGWPYKIALVIIVLLFVDAEFFWSHYLFHRLESRAHAVHHQFANPTAFGGWAFHWIEAAVYALAYFPILVFLPVTEFSALALIVITAFWNAYLHLGYEPLPESFRRHWLGQWLHTARTHCGHHQNPRYAYGLYFTFWDRLMGTDLPQ